MPDKLYAHYKRYGIAEPREFLSNDGGAVSTHYQGTCKCGWVGATFRSFEPAEHDCEEHMRLAADVA